MGMGTPEKIMSKADCPYYKSDARYIDIKIQHLLLVHDQICCPILMYQFLSIGLPSIPSHQGLQPKACKWHAEGLTSLVRETA